MEQKLACAILQIVSIIIMTVGASLTTSALLTMFAAKKTMGSFGNSGFDSLMIYGVWANASIVVWGLILCCASPLISKGIASH